MNVTFLNSADQLASHISAWDDLWQRSGVASPAFRAPLLHHWLTQFAAGTTFRAITVWDHHRMVAALPLVEKRLPGGMRIGTTTNTSWSCSGELLVDTTADLAGVAAHLVEALRELPWSCLLLRSVRIESPAWLALRSALARAGGHVFAHPTHSVGRVSLDDGFDAYLASLSGNHRRHMGKATRRIDREGGARLRVLNQLAPGEVRAALQEGFEVEDRSWKGAAGSSVLRTPDMFEYFVHQAELLAEAQQLHLVFLDHEEHAIAFEYGWRAHNTYFTPKVGYDEDFARFSPGQLLLYQLFRRFAAEPQPPKTDFDGPMSDATSRWTTETYEMGHIALSCRPLLGRGWVDGYRLLRAAKQWRARQR